MSVDKNEQIVFPIPNLGCRCFANNQCIYKLFVLLLYLSQYLFCKSRDSSEKFLSFSIALKPSTAILFNLQRSGSMTTYSTSQYCEFMPKLMPFAPQWVIEPFLNKTFSSLCKNQSSIWRLLKMFCLLELLLKSPVSFKRKWNSDQWNSSKHKVQHIIGDTSTNSVAFTWFQ